MTDEWFWNWYMVYDRFFAHGGAVFTFLLLGLASAALSILILLRWYRRRRGNQTAAARQRGSYPDEKGTQWGWAPKLNPQRGIQNVKGSMSSRRTFGLGEYGD